MRWSKHWYPANDMMQNKQYEQHYMAYRKIWGFKVLPIYSIFDMLKSVRLYFNFWISLVKQQKDTICTLKLKASLCNVHKGHIKAILKVQQTGK